MTIESVVIIIVGFAATVFLLSFSWWLWTRVPVPPPRGQATYAGPPLGPPPDAEQWMGWAQPNMPTAPPSPERERFEQSTLIPVGTLVPNADGDLDKARTMFFYKKDPEKTQILEDALDADAPQYDAPVQALSKVQTAPVRRASATPHRTAPPRTSRPPPPPPPRK